MNKVESVEKMELRQLKAAMQSLIDNFLQPQLEDAKDNRACKDLWTQGVGFGIELSTEYTIKHLKELIERGF